MKTMSNFEVHQWAIELAREDIVVAAREVFDLHPGLREFTVAILDDGAVKVRLPGDAFEHAEA
jgi:hypothetical protein